MVKISTNVMISAEASFSGFECYKAKLLIEEKEVWKEREKYNQPMAPTQNELFFVSHQKLSTMINEETIEKISLDSNLEQDWRILRFLTHQALRIRLRNSGLFCWYGFYSSQDNVATVEGKFGKVYDIFRGTIPRVFFEKGYCTIVFEPKYKVFSRFKGAERSEKYPKLIGFCQCKYCPEKHFCEEGKWQVSEVIEIRKSRTIMVNIHGKGFDCPLSQVLVETNSKATEGEYRNILRQTTTSTSEEYKFIHDFVDSITKGNLIIDLEKKIGFSWLNLEL